MTVTMLRARVWQDAGQERVLNVGQTYDLPDGVGAALVATGAAVRAESDGADDREVAIVGPRETGRRRRSA